MRVVQTAVQVIRRFASRSPVERRLLIPSFLLLLVAAVGLRFMPLVSVRRVLNRFARKSAQAGRGAGPAPGTVVWAVRAASGYIPGATCLVRALALQTLLGAHGWPTRLCVGFGHGADRTLGGHAWIEGPGGRVIDGDARIPYTPLLLFDGVRSE
jgi:hypothetical protein